MRKVIEYFDNICKNADIANKKLMLSDQSTGYRNRFQKMVSKRNNQYDSIGIYDYHTKQHVLFEMVNLVGQPKDSIPQELYDMESLINNAIAE